MSNWRSKGPTTRLPTAPTLGPTGYTTSAGRTESSSPPPGVDGSTTTLMPCHIMYPETHRLTQFLARPQAKGPVTYPCKVELFKKVESRCKPTDFRCFTSDICIPIEQRCDYVLNCLDGSDEISCRKFYCFP